MSTCNRFDLQTLGSQLVMPKNLPDHCLSLSINMFVGLQHDPTFNSYLSVIKVDFYSLQ